MKIFRDPIHNVINLDTSDKAANQLIVNLIDTKEFQRLRFIRQMGLAYLAYPSALHSRFEHSLGVAFLAKRFLDKILSLKVQFTGPLFDEFFDELKENYALTIVAALLHDIGHGPLSHACEEVTSVSHEKWNKEIIFGDTEINKCLLEYGGGHGYRGGHENCPGNVYAIMTSSKIISGQLDVDRMDYLLRDSHMTGSGYGRFDVEWLLNVLTVGVRDRQVEIGLDYGKGQSVAEDFTMARLYMYKNVYLHKTNLIAQNMLVALFERLRQIGYIGNMPGIERVFISKISEMSEIPEMSEMSEISKTPDIADTSLSALLDDYLSLTDIEMFYFLKQLRHIDDKIARDLADGLINRRLPKDSENWDDTRKLILNEKNKKSHHDGGILLFDKTN